jgi:battenin
LVDDTVIFAGRLRQAKLHLFRERQEVGLEKSSAEFDEKDHVEVTLIPGISHGFVSFVSVFPEAWKHIFRCANWILEIFDKPPHQFEGPAIESRLRSGTFTNDTNGDLELASTQLRHHRRTPTGESIDDDAPLVMSSLRDDSSKTPSKANGTARDDRHIRGREFDDNSRPEPSRSKSLVSLGSEEDLLKRRMKGLTISLMGTSHS